jgi:hypothetical protein
VSHTKALEIKSLGPKKRWTPRPLSPAERWGRRTSYGAASARRLIGAVFRFDTALLVLIAIDMTAKPFS